jgi:hypothetical protein
MKKIFWWGVVFFLVISLGLAQDDEILKLKEMIIDIQNKGELGFRNFAFCSNILGFGSYVPLQEPVLDKNGKLLFYYEPVNVFTNKKDGLYEIWYTQDIVFLSEKGEVLQEMNDALNFHYTAKMPVLDLFVQADLDLGGQIPAGKYKFKTVLKDKLSGKSATKIMDFEVR